MEWRGFAMCVQYWGNGALSSSPEISFLFPWDGTKTKAQKLLEGINKMKHCNSKSWESFQKQPESRALCMRNCLDWMHLTLKNDSIVLASLFVLANYIGIHSKVPLIKGLQMLCIRSWRPMNGWITNDVKPDLEVFNVGGSSSVVVVNHHTILFQTFSKGR